MLKTLSIILTILIFLTSCKSGMMSGFKEEPIDLVERAFQTQIEEKRGSGKIKPEKIRRIKIGVMLPLSGEGSKVGQMMMDAATLAVFDSGDQRISLVPINNKASEFNTLKMAKAAAEEGVRMIVGPLFSKNANVILPAVNDNALINITFSNDVKLAGKGVFLISPDDREQIARLVEHLTNNGYKNFAAIAPGDAYGSMMIEELHKAAKLTESNVLKTEFFLPNRSTFANTKRIVRALTDIPVDTEGNPVYENPEEEYKRALFIIASGSKLVEIMNRLKGYEELDLSQIQVVGTNNLNNDYLLEKVNLTGALFADTPPQNKKLFEERFMSVYGYAPNKQAVLAYDTIALLAGLVHEYGSVITKGDLTNEAGFHGISGVFRFRDSGLSERKLSIFQVTEDGVSMIEEGEFGF